MGADMNGHVGADANGYEGIHGGYGYGVCNEEGNRFLEMAQGLDMIVVIPVHPALNSQNKPFLSRGDCLV